MVIDLVMFMSYNMTMINLNINEAKAHLSSYIARVAKGEKVVICRRNKPVAELRPIKTTVKKRRPMGLAAKEHPEFSVDNSFFEPLPDDIVDPFSGPGS